MKVCVMWYNALVANYLQGVVCNFTWFLFDILYVLYVYQEHDGDESIEWDAAIYIFFSISKFQGNMG